MRTKAAASTNGFGGPSLRAIAVLLDRFGDPLVELPALLRMTLFTWLIGNADAHGKNVSLLIDVERGTISLAPLYDTVPTALWPRLRHQLAMSVNRKTADLDGRDFINEAASWGMGRPSAERVLDEFRGRGRSWGGELRPTTQSQASWIVGCSS